MPRNDLTLYAHQVSLGIIFQEQIGEIISYDVNLKDIIIPSVIRGQKVMSIGNESFKSDG